ncbi:alpha/beta fold hydrolase [Phaeobacter sp. HF9A]|uniref:alpha/beta fold hydrolase n=1 Tax=Phaeobacter sp. HF9A TaxID=2721561 RepID=UPI00142FAB2A|nr:alpha/beta fold hydrolase [Phaeobacter sp. HF9A]NIZ14895.1 alpha/beta fold hydrolase [Phaeobacter sp. HF9A]
MTTLVTIPGIMSDARTWAPVADVLQPHVSAIHVADTTQDATLPEMASRALAQTSGPLIVFAHSMGGRVAMEMGRQAPERIKAMILSSTSAEGPGANELEHRQTRIDAANADMTTYAANWAPKVLCKENAQNDALIAQIRQMVVDCGPEVHERQNLALLHRPDATTYIGDFPFPVLLITGDQDHLLTKEVHDAVAAKIPDATSLVLAGAGHLLPFEQPQAVSETVRNWLQEKSVI